MGCRHEPTAMTRPTVNDIAREAGVSLATVDRVLNARPGVRVKTITAVNDAIARLGYVRDMAAANLARSRSYRMAVFLPEGDSQFDNRLVRDFPNITNVDMSQTISQVQRVLGQVIRAVEFLFGFALAAGLVVLLATITATRGEREREYAVLRAVGAGSQLLRSVQRIELAGVGLLAGFVASLVAVAVGWALAKYAFQFSWQPPLLVPLAGSLAGGALALLAGWWGLRSVLKTPVVETLRRAAT